MWTLFPEVMNSFTVFQMNLLNKLTWIVNGHRKERIPSFLLDRLLKII